MIFSLLKYCTSWRMCALQCASQIPACPLPRAARQGPPSPFGRAAERGRVGLGNLQQDSHGVELMMGRLDLGHFDQRNAQGPDVCFVVIRRVLHRLAHHHLRGHPARGTAKSRDDATAAACTRASQQRLKVLEICSIAQKKMAFPPSSGFRK